MVSVEPFLQFGLVGLVLAWFMVRAEARFKSLEKSITVMTRAMLIDVLTRPAVSAETRNVARKTLRELAEKNGDDDVDFE